MIIFRADANSQIGMGHIMRCLSIADSFAAGYEIKFVLADENAEKLIHERGYETIILHNDYMKMDDEVWPALSPEYIVIDSYYVTTSYLRNIKKRTGGPAIVYIDDFAAFPYPVDFLVNYNIYGSYQDYCDLYYDSGMKIPELILGPTYVPLRTMFRKMPEKVQKQEVKNILVSTGGSDVEHIALKLILAGPSGYTYHVLIGNMNPDKNEIRKLADMNPAICLHENVSNMKSLIKEMDIAVSAAGSTLYEICACGVPLITYILADNQISGAEAFEKLGLAMNLGDMRRIDNPGEIILASVEKLAKDYEKRVEVGKKMQSMIDGYGADRIMEKIVNQKWKANNI